MWLNISSIPDPRLSIWIHYWVGTLGRAKMLTGSVKVSSICLLWVIDAHRASPTSWRNTGEWPSIGWRVRLRNCIGTISFWPRSPISCCNSYAPSGFALLVCEIQPASESNLVLWFLSINKFTERRCTKILGILATYMSNFGRIRSEAPQSCYTIYPVFVWQQSWLYPF